MGMDEHIILAAEEARDLLDLLWIAYEVAIASTQMVEAMRLMGWIEEIERRLFG
jgi:hypothetical protein